MNLRVEIDRDFLWTTCEREATSELFYNLIHQDYKKMTLETNTIPDFLEQLENLQEIIYEGFIDNNIAKFFMTYFLEKDYINLGLVVSQVFNSNLHDFIKFVEYKQLNEKEKEFLEYYFNQDLSELGKLISGVFSTSENLEHVINEIAQEKFND